MKLVKAGDRIAIRYRASGNQGRVLASSEDSPLELVVGSSDVLRGVSRALIGMKYGKSMIIDLPAAQAFGEAGPDVVRTIPRSRLPSDVRIGDALRLSQDQVSVLLWIVQEGAGDTWHLSSAHPFAGHDIALQIEVMGTGPLLSSSS